MNILKSSELINKTEYQKIYYHLNFDNILKSIFSGINQYRFFDIKFYDEQYITFKPKNDYFHLYNIAKLSSLLSEDSRPILMIMNEPKTFNIKHKKKILCYLHMDWILALYSLKEEDLNNNELIQYLQFETGDTDIVKKIRHINGTSEVRSNIYTMNKDSVIVNIRDSSQSKNISKLTKKNYNLILKNPLISLMEISKGFDNHKLTEFLQVMNGFSKKVLSVQKVTEEMRFNLKIRKIKRTNKKGMYIVNQNTILLDPRYVDSFSHELGHWYHTWFHKEIKTEKEAENFAIQFEDII